MNAVISGSAGIALILQGDEMWSFSVGDHTRHPRGQQDLHYLFAESRDLVFLEDATEEAILAELELAHSSMVALQLALMLCDPRTSDAVWPLAVADFAAATATQEVVNRVMRILCSRPMLSPFNLQTAVRRCMSEASETYRFFRQLLVRQPAVREVRRAWDELPAILFASNEKVRVESILATEGVFLDLVNVTLNQSDVTQWLDVAVASPFAAKLRDTTMWLTAWTQRLAPPASQASVGPALMFDAFRSDMNVLPTELPAPDVARSSTPPALEGESNTSPLQARLKSIPLFASLSEEQLLQVASIAQTKSYPRRAVIISQGEPARALYAVHRGRLKAASHGRGERDVVLGIIGDGEFFGEVGLLDGGVNSVEVTALEPCSLLTIDREAFLALLERYPKIAVVLLKSLGAQVRRLHQRSEDAAFLDVPSRLARSLLDLATRFGERQGTSAQVRLTVKLSQQELGDLVGSTRESINTHLNNWTRQGFMGVEQGRVVLRDIGYFRRLALLDDE